jgi:HAD superfamily hydrolase (TIGR01662 family)
VLRAVFFDVGETLVDERAYWRQVAALAGVPVHAVWAALGITIARGEEHHALFGYLGVERPAGIDETVVYSGDDLYDDALPCLLELRARGYRLGVAGNQSSALETWARAELPVDIVGSSAGWGVRKPERGFFERMVAEARASAGEVVYVGDRVDNDVLPARAAGLVAVHIRRGPWGWLQPGADAAALRIETLAGLGDALVGLGGLPVPAT